MAPGSPKDDKLAELASGTVPRTSQEKVALFRSLFRGRDDVYPEFWTNPRKDTRGYAPACANNWRRGICEKPRGRCSACQHRAFLPVSDQVILDHLQGRHVIGVYPLLRDERCHLLAVDFDKEGWKEDVVEFAATCQATGIPVALERSRSGNGAHAWFFFEGPVPAILARRLGCYLLTETMARRPALSLASYDRLFPNQDAMPKGGFGNLIALPLQREPRQHGNTVFLDERLDSLADQWVYLASVSRIPVGTVESIAREASRKGASSAPGPGRERGGALAAGSFRLASTRRARGATPPSPHHPTTPCPSGEEGVLMKTTARLTYDSLRFDEPATAHLVVTMTAPPLDAGRRPPVCVIPVVDVSGSMHGEKLQQAKLSVLKLIDHLGPQDRCGVVVFSTNVYVVSPPAEMSPAAKAALKLKVGDLDADAQTNLSGGMLAGCELGNLPVLPEGMLVRVILFTDGLANQGVATTSERLLPLLDAHRGRATFSAFGYGGDADQELLSDLARRGAGNYAFVAGPDDAVSAFARELGGLLSTYANGLEVRVTPAPGTQVVSVLSDVDATSEGGTVVMRLDDILAEEERHLVLRVGLPACPAPATLPAFQVEGRYAVVVGGALKAETFAWAVQVDRVEPPLAQRRPDEALDVVVAQAELLRAQLDAEVQARRGDYHGAVATLYQAERVLRDRGHDGVAGEARALGEKMRDVESFRGSAAHRKSMQAGLKRASSSSLEGEARERLDRMGKKHGTRAQQEMDDAFGGPAQAASATPPAPRRAAAPGAARTPRASRPPSDGVTRRRSRRW